MQNTAPIGFFDSGVGGLSVLKESLKLLPNENYIYFGDSINAPYGTKTEEEIVKLTTDGIDFLINNGVKAVVIACNTATSLTANKLRDKYPHIPILGIEPAIKPAIERNTGGSILVLATPMTLSKGKFVDLLDKYSTKYNIIKIPCAGLAELIESGVTSGPALEEYLSKVLIEHKSSKIDTVVLGCTHYPFVSDSISSILGNNIDIIDGSKGTVLNLKYKLDSLCLKNTSDEVSNVKIYNSLKSRDMIKMSLDLLEK